MELVVDANILFSAIVKHSESRRLLCNPKLELYSPEFLLFELLKHEDEIIKKSGLNDAEFKQLIAILLSRISVIPQNEFEHFLKPALEISPDPEDTPFIALCLSKKIPLWSNDKALKKQREVKVLTTEELLKLLSP